MHQTLFTLVRDELRSSADTSPTSSLRFCQRPHGLSSSISDSSSLSSSSSSVAAVAGGWVTMDTGGDTDDTPWPVDAAAMDSDFPSWTVSGACLLSPSDIFLVVRPNSLLWDRDTISAPLSRTPAWSEKQNKMQLRHIWKLAWMVWVWQISPANRAAV